MKKLGIVSLLLMSLTALSFAANDAVKAGAVPDGDLQPAKNTAPNANVKIDQKNKIDPSVTAARVEGGKKTHGAAVSQARHERNEARKEAKITAKADTAVKADDNADVKKEVVDQVNKEVKKDADPVKDHQAQDDFVRPQVK